jgi:hypothetical protein
MPEYTIRGTISFPFETQISADSASADFDLAAHYGVPKELIGYYALEDFGPLSNFPDNLTIFDRNSDYTIDSVEEL